MFFTVSYQSAKSTKKCMRLKKSALYAYGSPPYLTGMGLGIEFSRHQRQSQSSGAVLGSTDASGNSSSRESMSGTEEEGEGGCLYRAIYAFHGSGEDEVG